MQVREFIIGLGHQPVVFPAKTSFHPRGLGRRRKRRAIPVWPLPAGIVRSPTVSLRMWTQKKGTDFEPCQLAQ